MREKAVKVCKIMNGLGRAGCEKYSQNSEQSKGVKQWERQ